jgi:hypothetical protein
MCDASDYVVGAVLGQTKDKKHHAIAYVLTVNFRQPSHEFTFNVGIDLLF